MRSRVTTSLFFFTLFATLVGAAVQGCALDDVDDLTACEFGCAGPSTAANAGGAAGSGASNTVTSSTSSAIAGSTGSAVTSSTSTGASSVTSSTATSTSSASGTTTSSSSTSGTTTSSGAGGATCTIAPGNLLASETFEADADAGATTFSATATTKIELGGALTLSAVYSGPMEASASFDLVANGLPMNPSPIQGAPSGSSRVIADQVIDVSDPRWGSSSVRVDWVGGGSGSNVACASLSYKAPPGTEVLQDAWLEGGSGDWLADNGGTLDWASTGGLCGPGAAKITAPALADLPAELRSGDAIGPWPAGTTFAIGGAIHPQTGFADSLDVSLVLFVQYADNPDDSDEFEVDVASTGDPWLAATGSFPVTKAVSRVALYVEAGNLAAQDLTLLVDCFTVRAIAP